MRFTKVIYREISISGQRWTVAFGPRGVYAREVGKRRWKAVHWAAILDVIADYEGQPEGIEPPIAEPLAAIEDGRGTGREILPDAPPETNEPNTDEPPTKEMAAKWLASFRSTTMRAGMPYEKDTVDLGNWLKSVAGEVTP